MKHAAAPFTSYLQSVCQQYGPGQLHLCHPKDGVVVTMWIQQQQVVSVQSGDRLNSLARPADRNRVASPSTLPSFIALPL